MTPSSPTGRSGAPSSTRAVALGALVVAVAAFVALWSRGSARPTTALDGSVNGAVAARSLPGDAMARMKPEAAYFTADNGYRTVYFFIDLADASDLPRMAEPFFTQLNARVDFQPVMNADDLKKGLSQLQR